MRLKWELEYRDKGFMLDAMAERGQPMPPWLSEEPAILPGDEFYLDAFWELSTCRHIGMAMGPIPWDQIINYAQVNKLDEDLIPTFVLTIRALDTVYLTWIDKKQPKSPPRKTSKH